MTQFLQQSRLVINECLECRTSSEGLVIVQVTYQAWTGKIINKKIFIQPVGLLTQIHCSRLAYFY